MHYPYTIVSVALYQNNTEWLHESPNVLGGTIVKSGVVVVGIRQPLNTPTADDYVTINGLNWAKGNLVAVSSTNNRECKIGAPADGGLYFQFGSLIGWKGGNQDNGGTGVGMPQAPLTTDGTFWNGVASFSWANEAMVWPIETVGTKTSWTNTAGAGVSTLNDYYFNYSVAPWETRLQNIRDFSLLLGTGAGTLATGRYALVGVGDPCTYYLGGNWRLPTTAEYVVMCNNQEGYGVNHTWAEAGGSWTTSPTQGGNFANNQFFFPASGIRLSVDGSFLGVATNGYGWSSSVSTATDGYYLNVRESLGVIPQYTNHRSNGFPVRCVSE